MKINIDFKNDNSARLFYLANETILLRSIEDSLKGFGEPATKGDTFRIPTDFRHKNNHLINALNFIVENVHKDYIDISYVLPENEK